jgi:mevalonate kinase
VGPEFTDREAERLKEMIEIVKRKLDEICDQADRVIAAAKSNGVGHHAS